MQKDVGQSTLLLLKGFERDGFQMKINKLWGLAALGRRYTCGLTKDTTKPDLPTVTIDWQHVTRLTNDTTKPDLPTVTIDWQDVTRVTKDK